MDSFDYLFSFYGLLLGIAVANVAIGFADMWRDCGKIAVGYCPPLLGVIVMLGGMNVWLTMWHLRGAATVDAWQMLAATGVAMPYVFISRAMFPGAERETERSLEEHYLRHRRLILLVLVAPPVASIVSKILLDRILGSRVGVMVAHGADHNAAAAPAVRQPCCPAGRPRRVRDPGARWPVPMSAPDR